MKNEKIIGVDLGGTKVMAARIHENKIEQKAKTLITAQGSQDTVIDEIVSTITRILDSKVAGIGIGVPSVVDVSNGIVYDVQNIPSWKEVPLKSILENRLRLPVFINNDANCFALGEKYFGKGTAYANMIGLIVGTGMAAGIIIDHKLYNGRNCGAGEFGMIPYLDHFIEYYAAGQFFKNVHQTDGLQAYQRATEGDPEALKMYEELGSHLANGIMNILYALDPEVIIMGGSVSQAYPLFQEAMWKQLQTFPYRSVLANLKIEVSENPDVAVLGAGALVLDAEN
jgi:glucokinase